MLDVDGDEGAESLRSLERERGGLPRTASVVTPSGGSHFYFRHPGCEIPSSVRRLGDGLDVRADGAYVIAPPSPGYEPDEQAPIAEPPGWLISDARKRRNGGARRDGEPIPEGGRNNALTSIAGVLRQRLAASEDEMVAYLLAANRRCQPPLAEEEVRRIAASVVRYPVRGTPRVAPADGTAAAAELGEMLALPEGLVVSGCRIVGTGREATADIYLSDGRSVFVPKLTQAMNATALMELMVSTVGAEPMLKNPEARHCVALMRQIGETIEAVEADSDARQWGRDFLEAVTLLDADMSDQRERWGCSRTCAGWTPPAPLEPKAARSPSSRPSCRTRTRTSGSGPPGSGSTFERSTTRRPATRSRWRCRGSAGPALDHGDAYRRAIRSSAAAITRPSTSSPRAGTASAQVARDRSW